MADSLEARREPGGITYLADGMPVSAEQFHEAAGALLRQNIKHALLTKGRWSEKRDGPEGTAETKAARSAVGG